MRKGLLPSTPLRLTLILGAVFLIALTIAGITAFELIRQELATRIDLNVSDSYSVISQSYGENDLTDLIDTVNSHARTTPHHDKVYALANSAGRILAGNVTQVPPAAGWLTAKAEMIGVTDESNDYRLFVGDVGIYKLLVGASFSETNAIGRLTFTSLGWAGVVLTALVVITGLIIANRGQRRLDGIAATMHRIGRGELTARIATSGRNDDVDALVSEVNAALDRLAGLVEGMRQVSVDIAHDLKTPLNRLSITVEDAVEAEEAGRPAAEFLAEAQGEIRQLNATFDALLRIANIEAGARRSRFTALGLGDLLETIADAYGEVAREHGQTLKLDLVGTLDISGDRDLLVQMFANLVENAIRHCPPGTQIELLCRMESQHVTVIVKDTGPGIPESERDKVFQRLYRVEKSRTTPGTGLGLSLVKAVADLHGATLALSENGPGLCVTVRFPSSVGSSITNL
ncbi:ATP-binding protein [Devosia sp.]|uniref:sensor histidine kinase n=1 Tax=Devosia sp. TaxID=1871048 RepID=UPI003BAAE2E8